MFKQKDKKEVYLSKIIFLQKDFTILFKIYTEWMFLRLNDFTLVYMYMYQIGSQVLSCMFVFFFFFYCIMLKNDFTSHFLELFVIHKDFRVKSYLFSKIKKNPKDFSLEPLLVNAAKNECLTCILHHCKRHERLVW